MRLILALILLPFIAYTTIATKKVRLTACNVLLFYSNAFQPLFDCQRSSEKCANVAWTDMFRALSGVDVMHNICRCVDDKESILKSTALSVYTPIDSCVALALVDCYDDMEHMTKGLLLAFAHTVIAWCTHRHINGICFVYNLRHLFIVELHWHRDCLSTTTKEAFERCEAFGVNHESNITKALSSARRVFHYIPSLTSIHPAQIHSNIDQMRCCDSRQRVQ